MTPDHKTKIPSLLGRFARDETAATSVEYALISVIMAIGLLAAVTPVGASLVSIFSLVVSSFGTFLGG